MRKLFVIFLLLALCATVLTGEKRIVGARVNNQVMLLRVDLANYAMDASADGVTWSAIPGTSGEFVINDNSLSMAKLVQIPAGTVLGNVSGSTGNVTTLSAAAVKSLIGNATTSVSGLMSGTDKTKLDGLPTFAIAAPVSPAQGDILYYSGSAWSKLAAGTSGQVLQTQGTSANPIWATVSGGSGLGDVTGPASAANGNLAAFDGATGKVIKDSGVAVSGLATSGANSNITSLTGLTTPLSITQGGTGLSSLGSAGQVLTVNGGATAAVWATPSGGGGGVTDYNDLTNKPIDLTSYGAERNGNHVRFSYAASGGLDSYTKLLIHADGTDGETTFTDASSSGISITAFGAVSKSTSIKRFGTASASFGGGHISLANDPGFDVGSGDFTIDFWMYPTSGNSRQVLFFNNEDTYSVGLEFGFNGTRNIALWATATYGAWNILQSDTDGQENSGIGSVSIPLNEWSHVAFVRSGNTWMLFINGVLDISRTRSGTVLAGSQSKVIGGGEYHRNTFSGYIDEFRFSKGIARWTSGFIPQSIAYSADITRTLYVDSAPPADDTVAPSETTVTSSYTANYADYTIHRIKTTASTACALTVLNIPLSKALVIRVDNTAGGSVTFGGNTLIPDSTKGVRFLSFTNVTGTIELVQ